jgi:DNA-binding MarR family transcriptional regulator
MSEGTKRLLYERFLHFTHLTEQLFTVENREFTEHAQLQGIDSIPNNLTSVHVIDCIGNNEPINNTSIAEKMNLSKASISKISAKLLQEGFIKRSQMNDNKKEIYFSLTSKGRQIFEVHGLMHKEIEQSFMTALNSFSESELQASLKFIQTIIDQSKHIART